MGSTQNTMKECMGTDRPLVSIVMATYNPRMDWLAEQLASLNNQTYNNLELLIIDDCSTSVSLLEISKCVTNNIHGIPFEISRNMRNLGSTKTFEKLTIMARGKYIAYCDQDDIWHKEKIEVYLSKFSSTNSFLVFSDMNIINATGEKVAKTITKIRKRHKFKSGTRLYETLLFRNFVVGCAMMIRTEEAKRALPFCPFMVHDHWLALHCTINGGIFFIEDSLIDYRVHNGNQTLMISGVINKESYLKIRIEDSLEKFLWLRNRYKDMNELNVIISQSIEWMEARRDYFRNKAGSAKIIWKYRRFSIVPSLFELVAARLPEKPFMLLIELGRKNII